MTQTDRQRIELVRESLIEKYSNGFFTSYHELAIFLGTLFFASTLAIIKLIEVFSSYSLEWDSASFLTNAGSYAGLAQFQQAYDPTRPPVIPFVISILFRFTGPLVLDGYIVSAIFYVVAMVGCFLIAKEMMDPLLASLAAISFGVAPFVFEWAGIIISDVEGVAIASMAFAVLIISVKRNKRLLLVALPLLTLIPLTRYSLGAVIIAAILYLIAARKNDWILDHFEFYYGFGLSILVFAIFGGQWLAYPFTTHRNIGSLFPTPAAANPFHSILGPSFYISNLTSILGVGIYGIFLAGIFVLTFLFLFYKMIARKVSTVNPIAFGLLAWFIIMFVYYSFAWPYDDLRYSVEFTMPIMILGFYGLSILLSPLSKISSRGSATLRKSFGLVIIALVILTAAFILFQSGNSVVSSTQPLEVSLNNGIRQSVFWLDIRIPTTTKIESNWYTLLWWYAPNYNTTSAPLYYQLASATAYQAWQNTLVKNQISYVIYVDPPPSLATEMPILHAVFRSTEGDVVVYSVS
ncbi:MAG: glycosyltransferase family 39 protein [Nitrososphaerales archaeon]